MTELEAKQFVEELDYAIYQTQESYKDLNEGLNSIKKLITQFITFFNKQ
mgnify:CR=1 FL=1